MSSDPARPNPNFRIPYKKVQDHSIHLEVYLPLDDARRGRVPVLVWIHGGGWFDGAASDYSLANLIPVLSRGWAFVSLDYRLVPQVTLRECVEDVKDGIEFIQSGKLEQVIGKGLIDGKRLGVSGSSAGGALAIFSSYTLSPRPLVVFALYAGSDLSFPSFHTPIEFPSGRILWSEVSSDLDVAGPVVSNSPARVDFSTLEARGRTRACFYALQQGQAIKLSVPTTTSSSTPSSLSPRSDPALERYIASNLVGTKETTPPTVLVHGTEDLMVPIEISEKLFETLKRNGIETKLIRQVGANHGFDLLEGVVGDSEQMKGLNEALDFVAKYLE